MTAFTAKVLCLLFVECLQNLAVFSVVAGFWMLSVPLTGLFLLYCQSSIQHAHDCAFQWHSLAGVVFNHFIFLLAVGLPYGFLLWATYDLPWRGGLPWSSFRRHFPVWRWMARYFDHYIVKTADLPADRNYLLCSHPHGIIAMGSSLVGGVMRPDFEKHFPGLDTRLVTLTGQFRWPFRREFTLINGGVCSSRESIDYALSQEKKGKALVLVVGGLSECLATRPGRVLLKLKHRRGFVRTALRNGASLVPLFHFGENELFAQYTGEQPARFRNMQCRLKSILGFMPPLPLGSSLLGLPLGMVPRRSKLTSVMGSPIDVPLVASPTDEEVDGLFHRYIDALVDLFESHKEAHGVPRHVHLEFY